VDTEQRKKYDEQVASEYKNRKEKRQRKIKKEKEARQKALLEPCIKDNIIIWTDKLNNGTIYEGSFGKEKCFEIKRGLVSFSLKIIHKEIISDSKNNSSTELIKLQGKANEILWRNQEFLRKFKSVS
jgi:hypothetical protein